MRDTESFISVIPFKMIKSQSWDVICNFLDRYIDRDKIGIRQYRFYGIAGEFPNFQEIEKSNDNSLSNICSRIIYRIVFYASFGVNCNFSEIDILKWDASPTWSIRPSSEWGSIKMTTVYIHSVWSIFLFLFIIL